MCAVLVNTSVLTSDRYVVLCRVVCTNRALCALVCGGNESSLRRMLWVSRLYCKSKGGTCGMMMFCTRRHTHTFANTHGIIHLGQRMFVFVLSGGVVR